MGITFALGTSRNTWPPVSTARIVSTALPMSEVPEKARITDLPNASTVDRSRTDVGKVKSGTKHAGSAAKMVIRGWNSSRDCEMFIAEARTRVQGLSVVIPCRPVFFALGF